jgi:hypothetical protein
MNVILNIVYGTDVVLGKFINFHMTVMVLRTLGFEKI